MSIDYGMGATNINHKTGIRYGIIPAIDLHEWVWEDIDSIYVPRCPKCGDDLPESWPDGADEVPSDDVTLQRSYLALQYRCPHCLRAMREDTWWGDEPDEQVWHGQDGEEGFVDDYGDLWVLSSPYVTRGPFCSPCAPGAVYLWDARGIGAWAYCPGPEEFAEDRPCPYPVWRADDVDGAPIYVPNIPDKKR